MAKKKIDTGNDTPVEKDGVKKANPAAKKPVAASKAVKKPVVALEKEKKPAPKKQAAAEPILKNVEVYSRFTDFDIALFKSGKHYKLYEKLGSHVIQFKDVIGTYF